MLRFAANLSTLFTEHSFLHRFEAAARAGFRAVECQFPYEWPAEELRARLDTHGLEPVLINVEPGDFGNGERGLACLPDRRADFERSIEKAIAYANALGCPRVHCLAGIVPPGIPHARLDECYLANIAWAAQRCAGHSVQLTIEPINRGDIPGYFLCDFAQAEKLLDTLESRGVGVPGLQFDIYHCAKIHGDVCAWLDRLHPRIVHFQIAGTPDRHEPDVGDLDLRKICGRIRALAIDAWIGCEYRPVGRTEEGLGWIDTATA